MAIANAGNNLMHPWPGTAGPQLQMPTMMPMVGIGQPQGALFPMGAPVSSAVPFAAHQSPLPLGSRFPGACPPGGVGFSPPCQHPVTASAGATPTVGMAAHCLGAAPSATGNSCQMASVIPAGYNGASISAPSRYAPSIAAPAQPMPPAAQVHSPVPVMHGMVQMGGSTAAVVTANGLTPPVVVNGMQPATAPSQSPVAAMPRHCTSIPSASLPMRAPTGASNVSTALVTAQSRVQSDVGNPSTRGLAYISLLGLLESRGVFANLPLDETGILRIGAPFCHDFFEAPYLLPFLDQKLVAPNGRAKSFAVFGCDVHPQAVWWPAWQEWVRHTFPDRGSVHLCMLDLESTIMPSAGLVLGMHPEVVNGGPWHNIMGNVLRSRIPGARAVFATFYRFEAMECAKVCESFGAKCEMLENPYYTGQSDSLAGTFLRFIVILAPA